MVTMLEDAGLDRMLEINAAELMLAGKPRHHLEAKLLSCARTLDDSDARIERVIEMSASANRGADLVERGRIVAEAVSISDDGEEILGASQSSQRRGLGRLEDEHPGALGHRANSELRRARNLGLDLAPCDRLEARLRLHDVDAGAGA